MMLDVRQATKRFDEVVALDDVTFSVAPGERVALIGLNGAGKSTLLRLIAGLSAPTAGSILVDGQVAGSVGARAATSYIPDSPVLYDDLSLAEHIEYVARMHETEYWIEMGEFLVGRLGLSDRLQQLPATFSRGLRQKTSLVLGMVRPASLLLIDEPFVGLDRPGQEALIEVLDNAAAGGAAVVVATHQERFRLVADRCLGVSDGALVYDGPMATADLTRILAGAE